ncbi:hypothetical protein [Bradyrhizobium sp. DASA03120]|uniref:hypothetical protein n=1 Tax=Bradyrhizobium sp. SMVTL-02 TaxID=3395917 RepID=UPI003F713EC3
MTGDPWTPIDQRRAVKKALAVDGAGFNYKRVADLLDHQKYKAPLSSGGDRRTAWEATLSY